MIRILLLSTLIAGNAYARGDEPIKSQPIPGQSVIKVTAPDAVDDLIDDIDDISGTDSTTVLNSIPSLNIYTLSYPPDLPAEDTQAIRQKIDDSVDDGALEWGEANLAVDLASGQTDSLWVSGLGIDADGFKDQYALELLNIDQAQIDTRGEGVLLAIVDTGVDDTHPAIENCISPFGHNFVYQLLSPNDSGNNVDDDNDGQIDEMVGHGTFVAGLISLVSPAARILPVTVLNSDGVGSSAVVAAGITYAADQGSHVILLALGTETRSEVIATAVEYATDRGAIVVSPVGNGGELACLHPASESNVIAVAGSTHSDHRGTFSNYHISVDVCAPGSSEIIQGVPTPSRCIIGPRPGGEYFAAQGTSFSTAFAAGTAALFRAQHPEWPNLIVPASQIHIMAGAALQASSIEVPIAPAIGSRPRVDAAQSTAAGNPSPGPGDIDGDGRVGPADLGLALASWGLELPTGGALQGADLNCDFKVLADDIGLILALWNP